MDVSIVMYTNNKYVRALTLVSPIRGSTSMSRLLQIYYLYTWQSTRPSVGPPQCQGSYRFIICIHDNRAVTLGWTYWWACLFSCASIQIINMLEPWHWGGPTDGRVEGPSQCHGSYRFIICIHDNQHAHPWVHLNVKALTDLLFVYMTINTPIRGSEPWHWGGPTDGCVDCHVYK
jgi:hypothetical protein